MIHSRYLALSSLMIALLSALPQAQAKKEPRNCPTPKFLPFVLYYDCGEENPVYTPSGWMGNSEQLGRNDCWQENPQSGSHCIRLDYTGEGGWAGIAWQSPAMDWGDARGGFNLESCKLLTFWARADSSGVRLTVKSGGSTAEGKPFQDTGGKEKKFTIGKKWKQYRLSLSGMDRECIKTGFLWAIEGKRKPLTFYLDTIQYE